MTTESPVIRPIWLSRLDEVPLQRVRRFTWTFSIIVGALNAFFTRHTIAPDGLSYIDIGETYWRGQFHAALVSYWSPMYSWFVGGILKLLKPSPAAEYSVVHLLNFIIFIAALCCFEFLLRNVCALAKREETNIYQTFPDWAWYLIGYSLFLWCSIGMMSVAQITPELLLSCFLYLAAALLVRIRLGDDRVQIYATLGALLAFGYLSKGYVLVLSAFILATAVMLTKGAARRLVRGSVALIALAVFAGPYIAALSSKLGRVTATEAGKYIYCWHVNHVPWQYWHGPGAVHPPREIFTSPAVWEYSSPVAGHYPLWYDPGYWEAGLKPVLDFKAQARLAVRFAWEYFEVVWGFGALLGAIAMLHLYAGDLRESLRRTASQWFFLVPAFATLAIFGTLNVEGRYIAVGILLLWLALLLGIGVPRTISGDRLVRIAAFVMAVFLVGRVAHVTFVNAHESLSGNVNAKIADAMHVTGVRPGSDVAVIDISNNYPWARPAQVRIMSEVLPQDTGNFWASGDNVRQAVYGALRHAGATAVIARSVPEACIRDGWRQAGDTGFWVLLLRSNEA